VTHLEPLTKRSIQLLKTLFEKGKATNTYTLRVKQDELSSQLGVSRQALNVHLRKLKNRGYIRTGRGFIDVTEKGLAALGVSTTPAFILLKISPIKRIPVYEALQELAVSRAFRIAGEVDALIIVEQGRQFCDVLVKLEQIRDGLREVTANLRDSILVFEVEPLGKIKSDVELKAEDLEAEVMRLREELRGVRELLGANLEKKNPDEK